MNCRFDRCKTDEYDSVIRRLESAENKNLDQDNAIDGIRRTMPNASVVDTLTIDVDALQDEKLDNEYMDEDIHFGPITITKDGTAVIASLDAVNPITGAVTPLSFVLPGATTTEAGVMDASSVAWIADAENRISALEGLSDVKAVADLPDTPTQAQLTTGWVAVAGKSPETGDILQDINNSKLWVFVGTDWVLYGTIVTVPLATTSTIGGVRDTSLTAPGNRWYVHVEADGRLSLIGGDVLSTLVDTTVPALQSGINNAVKKTGDTMTGVLRVSQPTPGIYMQTTTNIRGNSSDPSGFTIFRNVDKNNNVMSEIKTLIDSWSGSRSRVNIGVLTEDEEGNVVRGDFDFISHPTIGPYATMPMRATPGENDVVNKSYLDTRLTAKLDTLAFDNAVKKSGDETIAGVKTFANTPVINGNYANINLKSNLANSNIIFYNNGNEGHTTYIKSQDDGATRAYTRITTVNVRTATGGALEVAVDDVNGEGYATIPMRTNPGNNDIINKQYLDSRLATKADKSELVDGLALKVDKGSTISASSVVSFNNVASNTWRQCSNNQVTNFVTFICDHQNFNVDISPDTNEVINVCKKADTSNADGSETATFMVPTNWYYRVTHADKSNRIIEQPITIN